MVDNFTTNRALTLSRSSSQCCILLVGRSGSGKSSTINHLFGLKQGITLSAETSDTKSVTLETKEYILTSPINDCSVRLVDSPGYEDTRGGLKQDACNLKTIKKFFEFPELKGKYPNLIFILLSATDNRYEGEFSQFVQTLKSIKLLNLIDEKNPNVIPIITKCCKMRPDYLRHNEEWRINVECLRENLNHIVYRFLGVWNPVVILENRFDSERGGERLEIPKREDGSSGEFSLLPNGELQPLNLYQVCLQVMQRNQDVLGERCLNSCFLDGEVIEITEGRSVLAKDPSKEALDYEEDRLLSIVKNQCGEVLVNPIIQESLHYINGHRLDGSSRNEIQQISSLLLEIGVGNATQEIIQFNLDLPITNRGRDFLNQILENDRRGYFYDFMRIFKQPQISTQSDLCDELMKMFGRGYDIFNDRFLSTIFEHEFVETPYGFPILQHCFFIKKKIGSPESLKRFAESFSDRHHRVSNHLKHRHIDISQIDQSKFQIDRSYPSINNTESGKDIFPQLTEARLFILGYSQIENLKFKEDFRLTVKALPPMFKSDDNDLKKRYFEVFDKYGCFFVSTAYGGGSLKEIDKEIEWKGGNTAFHTKKTGEDLDELKKWRFSLVSDPVILTTEFYLKPISEAVALIDKTKQIEVERAMREFIGSEFEVGEPQFESGRINTRAAASENLRTEYFPIYQRAKALSMIQRLGLLWKRLFRSKRYYYIVLIIGGVMVYQYWYRIVKLEKIPVVPELPSSPSLPITEKEFLQPPDDFTNNISRNVKDFLKRFLEDFLKYFFPEQNPFN